MRRALVLVALVGGLVAGCKSGASADSNLKKTRAINKMTYPVEVAPLELRQVSYTVLAPGTIEAFQQVQITARVAGAVDRVAFAEGQNVKQGDVLVTVETDRYQIARRSGEGSARSVAGVREGRGGGARPPQRGRGRSPGPRRGRRDRAVTRRRSRQERRTSPPRSQAVRVAQLNLRDAYVRAPIAGVVQSRTVQAGQYLQPGAVLATLLQRDPLLLRFGVSEQDAPRIKVGMTANMTLRESPRTYAAKVMLVAEAADPATRLVPVTAEVDDTEHKYWLRPGAFCEVNVPVGDARPAIVVPSLAVQPTATGNIVYVVDDKNVAHIKNVQLGMYTPDGGVEVTQGLSAGDSWSCRASSR